MQWLTGLSLLMKWRSLDADALCALCRGLRLLLRRWEGRGFERDLRQLYTLLESGSALRAQSQVGQHHQHLSRAWCSHRLGCLLCVYVHMCWVFVVCCASDVFIHAVLYMCVHWCVEYLFFLWIWCVYSCGVCVYLCVHMQVCVCKCVYPCVCVCVCTCVCVCVHTKESEG